VDLLPPDSALELLGKVIGAQRVAGESTAAAALVRMVGGLPLALRIVAARLAARPHWSLASMVGRLADERRRLDELAHGDLMVRASLLLTYEGLEAKAARLFRLLGVIPAGSTIPAWVAAALLDEDPMEAAGLLEQLVDMQMLDVTGIDLDGQPRYGFHAIIRLFAREQLGSESPQTRRAALTRVLGGLLDRADRVYGAVFGGAYEGLRGSAPRWRPAGTDTGDGLPADSIRWMEAEGPNLIAAVGLAAEEGLDELCWELTVRLTTLFETGGYVDEWQHTHERALEAVRAAGNRRGEAAVLYSLSELYLSRRRFAAARAVLNPAMEIAAALGDDLGLAVIKRTLAFLDYQDGDADRALDGYTEALEAHRRFGVPAGEAWVLLRIARIHSDRGNYQQATDRLSEALDLCRETGSRRIEGQVLHELGQTLKTQGRLDEADLVLGTVLELVRDNHDIVGEGYVLHSLGVVRARLGRRADAIALLGEAVSLREKILDSIGVARVYLDLAPLLARQGAQAQAVELVENALTTFSERKAPALENNARRVLESLRDLQDVSN
jgi:tetratricopeptide (TPR) repeat protein